MNFSTLPTSKFNGANGNFTPVAGVYKGKITKTEMKTSKTGNEYLSVTISLTDKDGKKRGACFEMFMDSDKSFIQYKLRRFVEACKIPCEGEMTLKDLGLLVANCELTIWTQLDEWNGKTRQVANLRDAEGYYPIEQFNEVYNIWAKVNDKPEISDEEIGAFIAVEAGDEELPFGPNDSDDEF